MWDAKLPAANSGFTTSAQLVAGTTYMIQSRWGDYSGIANDDAGGGAWLMAGTGRSSVWTTDIRFVALP